MLPESQNGLEGTFRGHLAQPPAVSRDIFNQTRFLRAPSNLALNVSKDGASTTSLGNLFQCFTLPSNKAVAPCPLATSPSENNHFLKCFVLNTDVWWTQE